MRILIVDNEPGILSFLRKLLQRKRYLVDTARLAETALKKIHSNPYDLIILGISPSDKKGTGIYENLRTEGIDTYSHVDTELSRRDH